ncbi:MAG: NADH-quinone oxidoreductase subunit NuoI [Nitrospira bacterium HGW-Nitrospira-1]|nr:MAG: NADH-quinone oxidoreductase subunit NuoI [Nitrospira bacterium HGW-Nitrospira-1]
MKLRDAAKRVFLIEIIKGLALTLKMMFTPPVTRRYPKEKRAPFPGFRGRHAFVRDEKTGREKCVACLKCAVVCPSQCITISYREQENGARILETYAIEAPRCIFCGYCAEVCPVCALVLTETYEYAAYSRASLYFDREQLLRNWDEFASQLNTAAYFNKFWRLPGIALGKLPVGKRLQKPVPVRRPIPNSGEISER